MRAPPPSQLSFLRQEPRDEAELLARARALAGRALAALAAELSVALPEDLGRSKGFAGTLVERALGASASSRSLPDFPHLGVELKTIPVDPAGAPRESTFVCTLPLAAIPRTPWEGSPARRKLARVLFVPLEAGAGAARRLGASFLWSPDAAEDAALSADWDAFATLVRRGEPDVPSSTGTCLQVRPKGRDAAHLAWGEDADGEPIRTPPRGIYLRASFTRALIARRFVTS